MPIREYLCRECGHINENFERNPEEALHECRCGSTRLERLPAAFGGYKMASGGGSTRPKGAGSFKGRKK